MKKTQCVPDEAKVGKGYFVSERGEPFKTLIINVLKTSGIKDKYIEYLTREEGIESYESAFTSRFVNPLKNYEYYENIGDGIAGTAIVSYAYEKFPQLKCSEGVKIVARWKINYNSQASFASYAEKLGFYPFIYSTVEARETKKGRDALLEDVLEAFIGCTYEQLSLKFNPGKAYMCCYRFMTMIFETMVPFTFKHSELIDAKSRLKEVFDMFKIDENGAPLLGDVHYEEGPPQENGVSSAVYFFQNVQGKRIKTYIGKGVGETKIEAENAASEEGIAYLEKHGYKKLAPSIYAEMAGEKQKNAVTEDSIRGMLKGCNINDPLPLRGKSKHMNNYRLTVLAMFCHDRNYEGIVTALRMGSNPNIADSDGMFALDLMLTSGEYFPNFVVHAIKKMFDVVSSLKIHRNVFEVFYLKYTRPNLTDKSEEEKAKEIKYAKYMEQNIKKLEIVD